MQTGWTDCATEVRQRKIRSRGVYTLVLITVALIAASVIILPLWRQYRQQQLNDRLFAAIRANDASAVVSLLKAGADATAHARVQTVSFREFLLAKMSGRSLPKGPDTLSVAMALALHKNIRGPYPVIHALLEHHANANGKYNEPAEDGGMCDGDPLCIMAANMEDMSCLRDLALHGANIDASDAFGRTALMYGTADRRIATVKILMALKAKVDLKDNGDWSALDFAQQHYGSGDHGEEDEQDIRERKELIRLLERGRQP